MSGSYSIKLKTIRLLMILIPIVVVCYFFVWENVLQRKEAEIGKNFVIAQSSADAIEHELAERIETMQNLASTPDIRVFNIKHINQAIKVIHIGEHENLFVTDQQGKIVAYTHTMVPQEDRLLTRQDFQRALHGEVVISQQSKSVFTDDYVITLYVPIFTPQHEVRGVIASELPTAFFEETIGQIKLGKTGHLSLVDSQGYYIYEHQLRKNPGLVKAKCFADCQGKNKVTLERPCRETGEPTIYAMIRLKNFDWYLIATQPSIEINTPGVTLMTKNIFTLILLLFSLIVLWNYKVSLEHRDLLVKQQNAEKLALVGELAAGMAHEIRNPLTTIKGFSDFLKEKDAYRDDLEILDLVSGSVEHIESIVRETLLLAKPQKRRIEPVNIQNVVEETYKLMEHQALLKEINVQMDKGAVPILVEGDVIHLKQVLVNLVKNALDASDQGGSIFIGVGATENQAVKIIVEDKGVGIPSDILEKLGMPFVTTKDNGTGLGLSVCRRIIDEHNGALRIHSKPGKGTMVEIELPIIS